MNYQTFETGIKTSGWELKSMWKLFNDSPAKKHIKLKRSDHVPLIFCQTTWVKDEHVASCAIDVWQFIVTSVTDSHCLILIARKINHVIY